MDKQFILDPKSIQYLDWLGQTICGCEMPDTLRVRLAAGCFAIAKDHYHAILALIERQLYASSFALLRCAFEAYVRGEWLSLCATDKQLAVFAEATGQPPDMSSLQLALERMPNFVNGRLSKIHSSTWKIMCEFTHAGGLHVQRWITEDSIEASYTQVEIQEVLTFAQAIGTLAALGVAGLAADEKLGDLIAAKFKECFG